MFRGFREIKEVRSQEKNLVKDQANGEIDITKRIKPDSMTFNEAQTFWDDLFNTMSKEQ